MDHPFINAGSLTDEEILKRMAKCHNVAAYAMSVGQNAMYESVMQQLEVYQDEYQTRLEKNRHQEYLDKNPDGVIDIGEVKDISNLRTGDDEQ